MRCMMHDVRPEFGSVVLITIASVPRMVLHLLESMEKGLRWVAD